MKKLFFMAAIIGAVSLSSCGSKKADTSNPFFVEWNTPFGIPPFDKISAVNYVPAFEKGIADQNAEIEAIIANSEAPSFENVIVAYDNSGALLDKVSSVFFNICSSELTDSLQQIQPVVTEMLTKHGNNVALNAKLFDKIKVVYDARESAGLSSEQLRLVDKTYKYFTRNGANLNETQKAELRKIDERLATLDLNFENNLLKEMNSFVVFVEDSSELSGLPQSVRTAAATKAKDKGSEGKWAFTLDKPSMLPLLQYADNRALRKKVYKGYLERCNHNNATDNKTIIDSIVNLRVQRANLLGYPSHAAFTLERNMAQTPDNVYALLNELWTPALKRAGDELTEMKAIKVKDGQGSDFESWDWWYYSEKLRNQKYNLDEEAIRPYLSLENVRGGIFTLVGKLYGITFKPVDNAPVYNEECQTYEVLDKDGSHLGALVMDFFPRPGKRVGAWCSRLRGQSYDDNGKRVAPIVTITCNFTRPQGDTPALLSLDETETFFHEFGHAVHGLCADVKYQGISGVSRDFVELPSQIMENWAMEPQMLKLYAKHYKTGEVIPDELITKINNAGLFNQGFNTVEYLGASLLDMDYHSLTQQQQGLKANDFENKSLEGRGAMKEIAPRYRSPYFQHIFSGGYSSGYYSYIWAEVLDKDAYQAFVETGDIFNSTVAESFRKNILNRGGSAEEMEMYKAFRGKEPSKEPLLKGRGLI